MLFNARAVAATAVLLFLAPGVLGAPPPAPDVIYPIGIQRPPVARVGTAFSFSFLPGTFNCSAGTNTLSYSVTGMPSWATFTPSTHTFSGTPPANAVLGTSRVVVSAVSTVDGVNSTATTDAWGLLLVPASWTAPVWQTPLSAQFTSGAVLGSANSVHANGGGVSVPPKWSWSLGLLWNTVVSPIGGQIFYTAYEEGTTSLPSWLHFNPNTVTFDGTTPEEEGSYVIVVFGSDHRGYGDISQTFTFAVSQHTFDLTAPLPSINATVDAPVNYTISTTSLTIDGITANASQLAGVSVDVSAAPYLSFDESTRTISGSLPPDSPPLQNISLPVTYEFAGNGTFKTDVTLQILPPPFTTTALPALNFQPGGAFSLDLTPYFNDTDRSTYQLGPVIPSNASSWVTFTSSPATLNGTAPRANTFANVTFDALQNGSVVGSALLTISVGSGSSNGGSSGTGSDGSPNGNLNGGSHGLSSRGKVILVAVLCAIGGLALLMLMVICCRQHCEVKEDEEFVDAVENPYPPDKKSPMASAFTATPNSFVTMVGGTTPKWKGEEDAKGLAQHEDEDVGANGMPAADAAVVGAGAVVKDQSAKRFDMFNIFHGRVPLPPVSQPSLQGLGIVAKDHQTVQVGTAVGGGATDADDEGETTECGGEGTLEGEDSANALGQVSTSDGQRSSWNTSASSSLFYSDTPGDDSEAFDGRSRRSVSASIPRRRADFQVPSKTKRARTSGATQGSQSAEQAMRENGGIRLVQRTPTRPVRPTADVNGSESIGAIATAALRKVSPPREPGEERDPDARPKLIPFGRQQTGTTQAASHPHRSSAVIHGMTESPVKGIMHVEDGDAGTTNRLSVYSGLYPQTEPTRSPDPTPVPTASPIFFSTPREEGWRSPTARSPISDTDAFDIPEGLRLVNSTTPVHSPNPRVGGRHPPPSASAKTLTASKTNQSQSSAFQDAPTHIRVAVGEPFHFTPTVSSPPMPGSPDLNTGAPRSQYLALCDDDLAKQLPEWVHFDAREPELWGIPTKADAGRIPIRIVERRIVTFPGSPGGGRVRNSEMVGTPLMGYQDEIEEVVSRFVIEVVDHPILGEHRGDIQVVTF